MPGAFFGLRMVDTLEPFFPCPRGPRTELGPDSEVPESLVPESLVPESRVPESRVPEGARLGAYRLVREIGRGAMAVVYEARHERLGHAVAIKTLASARGSVIARRRFEREGRIAARLRHPHIVRALDAGEQGGLPYLVMDIVRGDTLAAHLADGHPLPLEEVVALFLPVLAALAYAHGEGVVHRDLKPANVLVRNDGSGPHPMITDFGVSKAKFESEDFELTCDGGLVGSIPYMAPEQLHGGRGADERSDQFAVGVMMYQATTGVLPFRGATALELMNAIASGHYVAPRELAPALPAALEAVVRRALDPRPGARFTSARAFGEALLPFAKGTTWTRWAPELARGTPSAEPASRTGDSAVAVLGSAGSMGTVDDFATSSQAAHVLAPRFLAAPSRGFIPPRPVRRIAWELALATSVAGALAAMGLLRPGPTSAAHDELTFSASSPPPAESSQAPSEEAPAVVSSSTLRAAPLEEPQNEARRGSPRKSPPRHAAPRPAAPRHSAPRGPTSGNGASIEPLEGGVPSSPSRPIGAVPTTGANDVPILE